MCIMKAVLLAGLSLLLVGCGSDKPAEPPTPTSPTPALNYTLSGTVRDDAGAPLQGASVYVGGDPRRRGFGSAQTDAQGQYFISGLAGGQQPYWVSKPGYVSLSGTVSIGEQLVKDFSMRPGVVVSGRTSEVGVGPLGSVTIAVISGPNAGVQVTSTSWGAYGLPPIAPGDFTLRASKAGYESIDRSVHATVDTPSTDFTLKWSYGTCLTSVTPVFIDRVPSRGGTATVAIGANPDRRWTATPDSPWIEITSSASGTGSGTVLLRMLSHAAGALESRSGVVMIRCSATEGQNVWINQLPDCQTSVDWAPGSPHVFPAAGGTGHLFARNGVAGCRSKDVSEADWITLAGAGSYMTGEVHFIVAPNPTRVARTGVIVIGEVRWEVKQES